MDKMLEVSLKVAIDDLTLADIQLVSLENNSQEASKHIETFVEALQEAREAVQDILEEKE